MSDGCKHGNGPPSRCSQCAGVTPRRVDQAAGQLFVDGIPARPIDAETQSASRYYGKRGKRNSMRVTRSKR